jgi:hypothetical protein
MGEGLGINLQVPNSQIVGQDTLETSP